MTKGWSTLIRRQPAESVESPHQTSLRQACLCAKIADDYRGKDTIVLDLSKITPLFDYFVITTGTSPRQMRAIAEEVDRVLELEGSERIGLEGVESGTWILQDYGDVVLHIFEPKTREVYDLEHLWADASPVDWRTVIERSTEERRDERIG